MTHYYGVEFEFSADTGGEQKTFEFFNRVVKAAARKIPCAPLPNRFANFASWQVVGDCSAETTGFGLEIRSPVLSDSRFKQFKAVMQLFKNNQDKWISDFDLEICPSAHGMHVHFDMRNYHDSNMISLLKRWCIVESALLGISIPYEREDALLNYAAPIMPYVVTPHHQSSTEMVCQLYSEVCRSRYYTLNFTEKLRNRGKGTVELRAPGATLNTDYLWSWIQIMKALIRSSKYGRKISDKDFVTVVTNSDNVRNNWQLARAQQTSYRLLRWMIPTRMLTNHELSRHIETLSSGGV